MRFKTKRNKYNAKPQYVDGIRFASKKEAERYKVLKIFEIQKEITDLELQPIFTFPMGFSYRADFKYKKKNKIIVEDVKGLITYAFQLKAKCFKYFYPELELRVVR